MTERKVRNRYHYFLKRTFSAVDSGPDFEIEINVPFDVDELVLRDVANVDILYEPEEINAGASTTVVAVPVKYVHTLALDGVGQLCSFTNDCYMKLDNTFKVNGRSFSGLQRFRITDTTGKLPTVGQHFSGFFTAHLEFILYERG